MKKLKRRPRRTVEERRDWLLEKAATRAKERYDRLVAAGKPGEATHQVLVAINSAELWPELKDKSNAEISVLLDIPVPVIMKIREHYDALDSGVYRRITLESNDE